MKLKTLKDLVEGDIEFEGKLLRVVKEKDLRQEAIKWIKYLKKLDKKTAQHPIEIDAQIGWIMHFFNITEEDLK